MTVVNSALKVAAAAMSLAKLRANGKVQQGATTAGLLLQIIGKGVQVYEEHTGEKFDLSLIKPESPV